MARKPRSSKQTSLLLSVLAIDAEQWRYGYELSQLTGLKSGTLYPLLIRLSDLGWLEARWREPEREGRPPRHEYRLTGRGAEAAKERAADGAEAPGLAVKGVVPA